MENTRPEQEQWPRFEIAIEGEGLTPAELPLRNLIALLEAACGVVEAVAGELGCDVPSPCLVDVHTGSAAYDLEIHNELGARVLAEVRRQITNRASGAPREVRRSVMRMHNAGDRIGSVRFAVYGPGGTKEVPVYVAAPAEHQRAAFTVTDEIHATVVAVSATARKASARLRLDDGKIYEYELESESVARKTAALFLKTVIASIEVDTLDGQEFNRKIVSIDSCEHSDEGFLVTIDAIREELFGDGIRVTATDWLKQLEGDE